MDNLRSLKKQEEEKEEEEEEKEDDEEEEEDKKKKKNYNFATLETLRGRSALVFSWKRDFYP